MTLKVQLGYPAAAINPYGYSPDELAMLEQYHCGQHMEDFSTMVVDPRKQKPQQQRMHDLSQGVKKAKPDLRNCEHFVALLWDPETQRVVKRSSNKLRKYREDILHEAALKLAGCMERNFSDNGFAKDEPMECVSEAGPFSMQADQFMNSGRKTAANEVDIMDSEFQHESSCHNQDEDLDDADEDRSSMVSYRADARDEWEKWFGDAFRAVQQVSCRVIAKEWIKAIHPKKQSTHPYNGKNPRTGEKGDSNSTKPPYWPKDVIHKEPDHINKEARTKLLVHLLMSTPHTVMSIPGEPSSGKEINAAILKDTLDQKKLERQREELSKKFPIIEHIIYVRTRMEECEEGGMPGEGMITVPNYSDFHVRGANAEDESDELDESIAEDAAEADEYDIAPSDTMNIVAELPQSEIAAVVSGKAVQLKPDQVTGVRRKGVNESRRSLQKDEPRLRRRTRRTPRSPMPMTRYPEHAVHHPSTVLSGWDPMQLSHPPKREHICHPTGPVALPHRPHETFWNQSVPQNMEMMTGEFNEHCMMSPTCLPDGTPTGYFVNRGFPTSHQSFPDAHHAQGYCAAQEFPSGMHDRRPLQARGVTPYQAFFPDHPPPGQEMMAGPYQI